MAEHLGKYANGASNAEDKKKTFEGNSSCLLWVLDWLDKVASLVIDPPLINSMTDTDTPLK